MNDNVPSKNPWAQRLNSTENLASGPMDFLSAKIVDLIRTITELNNKNLELKKELDKLKK